MSKPFQHALTGLKVLDLSRALAGPACTRMLAEMGAEVIKVEPATRGDMVRGLSIFKNGRSLYYVQQNRGKKGMCVNLRDDRGRAIVEQLVTQVDIVVENFKPGVLDEMGLGFERLRELKSDIILCSISALGQDGPLADRRGYDYIAQAYSGVTSMIGEPDDAPYIPLNSIGDVSTGVHAALAILAALRHRDNTGEGQQLDIALLDVYYSYHEVNVHTYSGSDGQIKPTRGGRHISYLCPGGVFRCREGSIMIMGGIHHWRDVCRAMDRTDLIDHPDYKTDALRHARLDEIIELIEGWLNQFPDANAAVEYMERFDIPVAPVLSVAETVEHPHHRFRGTVQTVTDPIHGEFQMPGFPLRFSAFPEPPELVAPTLGEHNEEVLKSRLGRSDDEIAALYDAGVLVRGKT